MLNSTQMTVQLDPAMVAPLNELAHNQQRSEDAIVEDALSGYFSYMAWFEAEVEKGRKDIREGRFITHEELGEKLRARGITLD